MKQVPIYLTAVFLAVSTYFVGAAKAPNVPQSYNGLGSVQQGSEYHSTSTGSQYATPAQIAFTAEPGTLGSVVITGANTGIVDFYDATTTDVNKRTGQKPTSTIRVANIPASLAAGTYTFDVIFVNGLMMVSSGLLPTTTITWR